MKSFIAAILFSAICASGASAATFTVEADFNTAVSTALGTLQSQGFDGFSTTAPDNSLAGSRDFGGFTTSLNSVVTSDDFNTVRVGGMFNSNGLSGNHLHIGLLENETFTITFKSAVIAFGALFAGVNNGLVARSDLWIDNVQSGTWLGATEDNEFGGLTRFFGIVQKDTPFTSITFRGLALTEGFGIDNVQWAAAPVPVPVPASGILLMGAMFVAGLVGRRRARA